MSPLQRLRTVVRSDGSPRSTSFSVREVREAWGRLEMLTGASWIAITRGRKSDEEKKNQMEEECLRRRI